MNKCQICNKPTSILDVLNFIGHEYYVHDCICQTQLLKELENNLNNTDINNDIFETPKTQNESNINNLDKNVTYQYKPRKTNHNDGIARQLISIQLVFLNTP